MTLFADRSDYENHIKERRVAGASFKHDRQVRAEAEAIALIERARHGSIAVAGRRPQNGYFLSYTSLLNDIAKSPTPVTMKPEAALSWLSTLRPAGRDESRILVSEMLWELQERRMNLVDQATLIAAFGPLITATKRELAVVIPKYQALVAQQYGGDHPAAVVIADVADLDVPVILDALQDDRVHRLEALVEQQAAELDRARVRAADAEATSAELDKMRAKQKRKNRYERRMARQRGHRR